MKVKQLAFLIHKRRDQSLSGNIPSHFTHYSTETLLSLQKTALTSQQHLGLCCCSYTPGGEKGPTFHHPARLIGRIISGTQSRDPWERLNEGCMALVMSSKNTKAESEPSTRLQTPVFLQSQTVLRHHCQRKLKVEIVWGIIINNIHDNFKQKQHNS